MGRFFVPCGRISLEDRQLIGGVGFFLFVGGPVRTDERQTDAENMFARLDMPSIGCISSPFFCQYMLTCSMLG